MNYDKNIHLYFWYKMRQLQIQRYERSNEWITHTTKFKYTEWEVETSNPQDSDKENKCDPQQSYVLTI